jgi:beta-phosphoglucomutase
LSIKAIVFDMDGVLIDAREWHYDALNRALAHFGFTVTRFDHLVSYDGLPTKQKLEMLSLEQGLPRALHGFINELKQQYTLDLVNTHCRPTFQHEYALSRLKSDGFQLGVGSNSVRSSVDTMLTRAQINHYFDVTLSNEDVRAPKPDPEIYTRAIARLGCRPNEALVVEDNPHGVRAAIDSGAHLLQVETPQDVTYTNITNRISQIEAQSMEGVTSEDTVARSGR